MTDEARPIEYFAYGANMSRHVFVERRGMRPLASEVACLSGHRLVFSAAGFPIVEPAFATITPESEGEVHGVLYRLSPRDAERLRQLEDEYACVPLSVVGTRSGPTMAEVYVAQRTKPGLRPSRRYLAALCGGAREAGLPAEYVAWLEGHASVHVPVLSPLAGLSVKLVERFLARSKRSRA